MSGLLIEMPVIINSNLLPVHRFAYYEPVIVNSGNVRELKSNSVCNQTSDYKIRFILITSVITDRIEQHEVLVLPITHIYSKVRERNKRKTFTRMIRK